MLTAVLTAISGRIQRSRLRSGLLIGLMILAKPASPVHAQDLLASDIEQLQMSIADATSDLAALRDRVTPQLQRELRELGDEVTYLTVRLRKGQTVPRIDYQELRDRIDTLRIKVRGMQAQPLPGPAPAAAAPPPSPVATPRPAVPTPAPASTPAPPATPATAATAATLSSPSSPSSPSSLSTGGDLASAMMGDPPAPVAPEVVSRGENGRVTLRAVRIREPLRLDGRLDESFYQTVAPVSDFIQQDPNEGSPATEKTEAWIFYDDRNLYVSGGCWDSHPERDIANEMKRDGPVMQNENFAILLDTFRDHRSGFVFHVNPLGGMFDADVRPTMNRDWNGVWDVKTGKFEGGWTVEIVIPFKTLRYRGGGAQVWGVNLRRIVKWKNEMSYLVPVPAAFGIGAIAQASRTGALVGLEIPGESRTLEFKPYAIADLTTNRASTPKVENDPAADFGFDAKVGLTRGITADITYNTDFAQVEVDEQQVNLTRTNLFFPEKREFFLEGQGIFDFGGVRSSGGSSSSLTPVLFFSRRIGLSRGQTVPIDGGGRLTGRVGKFTLGALHIQTADQTDAPLGRPATSFDVVRLKRDILRRSTIGALVTRRSVSDTGGPESLTYGTDAAFSFKDRLSVNASLARTDTPGIRGNDLSYRGQLDYNADRYGAELERLVVESQFNPQVGFLSRGDFRRSLGSLRFSPRPRPGHLRRIRKFFSEASADYIENGSGALETRTIVGAAGIDLQNSDIFRATYTRNFENLEKPFTVYPGVILPTGGYSFNDVQLSYGFGQQHRLAGTFSVTRGQFYDGAKTSVVARTARLEVTKQFYIEPGLSLDQVDLPEGAFTSKVVNMRTTYTVTPRMFVAALITYNATTAAVSSNARLRWEYTPGSEFFIVYTEERDSLSPHFPALKNRALAVKFNLLIRF